MKTKNLETSLVLTTACLVIWFFTNNILFVYPAMAFGLIGLFIPPLARLITKAWFRLADILNFVMSRVVLSLLFFVVLLPIAWLSRLVKRNALQLKNNAGSLWVTRQHTYSAPDLKNIW